MVVSKQPMLLEKVHTIHSRDLEQDLGQVYMQSALTRKSPKRPFSWGAMTVSSGSTAGLQRSQTHPSRLTVSSRP